MGTESIMKHMTDFRRVQPSDGVPTIGEGKAGFVAPKEWKI